MVTQAPASKPDAEDVSSPAPAVRLPGLSARTLIQRLFNPIDIASLVFFRIFFGIISFWHVWEQVPGVRAEYITPDFHFSHFGLEFLEPLPGEGMNAIFLLMAASTVFIALGFYYRWAAIIFFLTHTYAFMSEQAGYWNHYYLTCLLAFVIIFLPLNRAFSLDVMRGAVRHSDFAPSWALWALRIQMGLTYFYAGLAKINSDWLRGTPMDRYLRNEQDFPFIGPLFDSHNVIMIAAYSGLLLDLLIVPALLWRKTRYFALAAAVGFHLFNSLTFDIEVFPWLALSATLLFLPPEWPRFGGQWRRLSDEEPPPPPRNLNGLTPTQKVLGGVLVVYFLFQFLVPLRHYLYPGQTLWTGEGYFFSWRMLIAAQDGRIQFHVTDKATGAVCRVNNQDYIAGFQNSKLGERPDMMVQYAHYLKKRFKEDRGMDVEVRAWGEKRLNDRPFLQFTDPTVDLTTMKRTLGHQPFIIPLDQAERIQVPAVPRCAAPADVPEAVPAPPPTNNPD